MFRPPPVLWVLSDLGYRIFVSGQSDHDLLLHLLKMLL